MKQKKPKEKGLNWRGFLTSEEERIIKESDVASMMIAQAQSDWARRFGAERPKIVKRATDRARAAARLV